ncbi:MAG: DUF167 domain-containing protein [Mariprofundaceae bacterium]
MLFPESLIKAGKGGIYLRIHAQPGAKNAALRGLHGEAVKIAVKEAAQDGKANKAIEHFIAKELGLSKSSVSVTSGHTSRSKRLFIDGEPELLIRKVRLWLGNVNIS